MAMTFNFNIHPFGYQAEPIKFGEMEVHSAGDSHEYAIGYKDRGDWKVLTGKIPKLMPDGSKRSGHRNYLHLLRDILNTADLDSIGEDYVHVLEDIREQLGSPDIRAADYPED